MSEYGLFLEEGHEIIYTDGDVTAIRQNKIVEVWDATGETYYGELPETATASDVMTAMKFYMRGHEQGQNDGMWHVRRSIKAALGISA